MLTLLLVWLLPNPGFARPLAAELPQALTADYPETQGFVQYARDEQGRRTPLLGRLRINSGQAHYSIDDVFEEQFFAFLPTQSHIAVSKNEDGQEVWSYPPQTKVLHRVWLRTEPRRIFEMRIDWLRADGSWAFGLYAPKLRDGGEEDPVNLQLLRIGGQAVQLDAAVVGSGETGLVRITGERINPESCQACHFVISPGRHQYENRDSAGPCGFVPGNPALAAWAESYERRYGYVPFTRK